MNINKLLFFLIIFISAFSLNADEIKSDRKIQNLIFTLECLILVMREKELH
jgi:hypothetical protein